MAALTGTDLAFSRLMAEHTAVGKASQVGWNAPKKFTATYGKPAPVADTSDPFAL